ncbi:MAG: helix-turn-helix domain-containing protein [Candidatus Doudnabacteria bacterium]|nr:helix-turn-helix domain-containing protein [Candidatus Doudnabacteria bacterium]
MTKLSKIPLDPKDFGLYVNNLWSVFTLLDSKEDIRFLFKDLFTHTENKMFTKRLEIARALLEGETYDQISERLKVTKHTIASVSNTLARDGNGFRVAHAKLLDLEKQHQRRREKRQDYLEGKKRWPKFREQVLVEELAKAGARHVSKYIRRKKKRVNRKKEIVNLVH